MKSANLVVVAAVALGAWAACQAQQPADTAEKLFNLAANCVARLEFTYANDIVGTQKRIGQAICLDAAKGIFITYDIPNTVPEDEMKDFALIGPRDADKKVNAELLDVDANEGIGFLRADKHEFKSLEQAAGAKLTIGMTVYAVGLLGPQTGNYPYLGQAAISSMLRLPSQIVMVNGDLTVISSPVLSADGKLIGIIGSNQLPLEYRMRFPNGQATDVGLSGTQYTRFFVPLDEISYLLAEPPAKGKGRRMPWIGVLQFKPVAGLEAKIMDLEGKPAALVEKVQSGSAAEKAGIKQGDAVIGLNGKSLEKMATPELTEANFRRTLFRCKPGDKINLTIWRDKAAKEVPVTLEPMPDQPHEAARYYNRNLGFAARDLVMLDRDGRAEPLKSKGALVTLVLPSSPAEKGNLKQGDIIVQVGDKTVNNIADFAADMKAAGETKPVSFQLIRNDKPEAVTIRP